MIKKLFAKLFPVYTVEDVLSGKVTREQYRENYKHIHGNNVNPPYDERIHGPRPSAPPPHRGRRK